MALMCALLSTALIATAMGAVVLIVSAETMISANYRSAQHGIYGVETGIERAMAALRAQADWRALPAGAPSAVDFDDGAAAVQLADGIPLVLATPTADLQSTTDARSGASANRPVWHAFVHAPLDRMLPRGMGSRPDYIVVWLADDADESDGDPMHDSNDVLMLHAEAYGLGGSKRCADVVVRHEQVAGEHDVAGTASSGIRVVSWREGP